MGSRCAFAFSTEINGFFGFMSLQMRIHLMFVFIHGLNRNCFCLLKWLPINCDHGKLLRFPSIYFILVFNAIVIFFSFAIDLQPFSNQYHNKKSEDLWIVFCMCITYIRHHPTTVLLLLLVLPVEIFDFSHNWKIKIRNYNRIKIDRMWFWWKIGNFLFCKNTANNDRKQVPSGQSLIIKSSRPERRWNEKLVNHSREINDEMNKFTFCQFIFVDAVLRYRSKSRRMWQKRTLLE